jgi:hypothetical protein
VYTFQVASKTGRSNVLDNSERVGHPLAIGTPALFPGATA